MFLNRILMEHLSINALGLGVKYIRPIEVDLEIWKISMQLIFNLLTTLEKLYNVFWIPIKRQYRKHG